MHNFKTIGTLIIIITTLSFCSSNKQKQSIIWKETIGTIDPTNGYKNAKLYYKVNDHLFEGSFPHSLENQFRGEKYTMRYNVNNPNEIEIDYWNQVFEQGEKTLTFIAKVEKIHTKNFLKPWPFIVFTYSVRGKQIENCIYLPPDFMKSYPNLKVGQYYEVQCWDENVWRAVLHFDKPINHI
jgi:hypothetical protein